MGLLSIYGFGGTGGPFGDGSDGSLVVSADTYLASTTGVDDTGFLYKQYRDLTIQSGAILGCAHRVKAVVIFVKGNLTVDGQMVYTGMGAAGDADAATGAWLNPVTTLGSLTTNILAEFVTKAVPDDYYIEPVGNAGAIGPSGTGASNPDQEAGTDADAHHMAGGGSGGIVYEPTTRKAGNGARGTLFAGGTGGGGMGQDGAANGGDATVGGQGGPGGASSATHYGSGGGAGFPGGAYGSGGAGHGDAGETGAGPQVWIVVGGDVTISGAIRANGKKGGDTENTGSNDFVGGAGGGSGGGMIKIFHRGTYTNTGTVEALAGAGGVKHATDRGANGGPGGAGHVEIVDIGSFFLTTEAGDFLITEDDNFITA